jgi:hypothetical protein
MPPLSFRGAPNCHSEERSDEESGFSARSENPDLPSNCIFSLYLRASRYNCGPQPQGIVTKKFCSFAAENQFAQLSCGKNALH